LPEKKKVKCKVLEGTSVGKERREQTIKRRIREEPGQEGLISYEKDNEKDS